MNAPLRRLASFAVLFFFTAACVAQEQTVLRWNFQQGGVYKHRTVQRIRNELEGPQGNIQIVMDQEFYTTQRVKSVSSDGSTAVLEVTVDRVVLTMDLPTGKVTYDSAQDQAPMNPAAQQLVAALKPFVGSSLIATVDSRGNVQKLELPEALKKALQQSPVSQQQDDQLFRNFGGQGMIVFPEEAVSPGSTWTIGPQQLKLPFGTLGTTITYTYAGRVQTKEGVLHKIGINLRISSEPAQGGPVSIELSKHSGKGEAYVDENITHLVKSAIEQEMEIVVTAQGQKITQKVTTETQVQALPNTAGSN